MKKITIAISALLLSINCFAAETDTNQKKDPATTETKATTPAPIEIDQQYIELPTLRSPDAEVIEFFSFNCPSCLRFETEFHGTQAIEKALPTDVKFKRYHLDNFGALAPELSEAWAIANVLGVQDKVTEPLYNAVQKERKIKTADDIKAIFATIGVDNDAFDKAKDNFLVKAFMAQQAEALKELQPTSIPAVIVNRKYYINPRGLDQTSNDAIIADYARVAAFLTELKPKTTQPKSTKPVSETTVIHNTSETGQTNSASEVQKPEITQPSSTPEAVHETNTTIDPNTTVSPNTTTEPNTQSETINSTETINATPEAQPVNDTAKPEKQPEVTNTEVKPETTTPQAESTETH